MKCYVRIWLKLKDEKCPYAKEFYGTCSLLDRIIIDFKKCMYLVREEIKDVQEKEK